ncbi:DNA-binding protein [Streptomyces klenkii]
MPYNDTGPQRQVGGASEPSHAPSRTADSGLPRLFTPAEVAVAIGCSDWWVKEQARKHRVPFTRLGGAYRFTADHFAEIIRLFEERPPGVRSSASTPMVATRPELSRRAMPASVQLRPKRPRRTTASFSERAA